MDITIGDKIKEARDKVGWSQSELARRAEIQPSTISQIESGARKKPTIDVLQKIAGALSTTVSQLLGQSNADDIKELLQNKEVLMFFKDFKNLPEEEKNFIRKQIENLKPKGKKK